MNDIDEDNYLWPTLCICLVWLLKKCQRPSWLVGTHPLVKQMLINLVWFAWYFYSKEKNTDLNIQD